MRGAGWLDGVEPPHETGGRLRVGRLPHLEPAHVERCGEAQRQRVRLRALGARRPRAYRESAAAGVGRRTRGIGRGPTPAVLAGGGGGCSVLLLLRPGDAGRRQRGWWRRKRRRRRRWGAGHVDASGRRRVAHELYCIDIFPCIDRRLCGQLDALCEEARSLPAHVQHVAAQRAVRALPHQMHRALLVDGVDALHKPTGRRRIGVLPHAHALCIDQGAKVERERVRLGVLGPRRPRAREPGAAAGVGRRAGGLNCRPCIILVCTACVGRSGVLGELARVRA